MNNARFSAPRRGFFFSRALIGLALAGISLTWTRLPAAPAEPAAGPVSAADRLFLDRIGEALVLSRAAAERIWPGWGLEKTPLLIYEAGRVAFLVNHPAPPADFQRLEGKVPLLGAVFAKFGRDARFNANTSIELGGLPTACIGFSTAPSEAEAPSLRFIALVFHEAFHAHQAKAGKPGKGAVEALLLRYPDLNAENLALAQMEQMILFQLVRFDDAPDPDRLRAFLAVRAARQKSLGAEFLHAERGIEYQEGLPTYVEVRLLEEARKATAGLSGFGSGDPYSLGFSVAPELRVSDYLSRLLRFSSDAATIRSRAYATGMALGLLLDRLGADWKTAALSSDKYLDEILADNLSMPPGVAAAALARAKKDLDYDSLFRIIQEKTARLGAERKLAAENFMKQPGIRIELKPPDGPVEVRGFDPLNVQPIDAGRAIHRRLLRLAFGEGTFSASGVPVLVGLGNGPFDIKLVTVFVPAEDLLMETDFAPLALEPGSRTFRGSFKLTGGGVSLQASSGTISVSPDKSKIEIELKR
ncbi:MAG TPA: hypothetical protein VGR67_08970 [Candidatus Polarisedimenticolia bacterium]|jgi:hypothetical protein|nr:hypothetical protein [Candidatus Polarisedimenticolia bacterium]